MATPGPPLLELRNLKKYFPVSQGTFFAPRAYARAVDGVSLQLNESETLGLVGESGCGKSTVGRLIVRLAQPTSGSVMFRGDDIAHVRDRDLKPFRRQVQMIFQDPYSSLNPRMSAGRLVAEPFLAHHLAPKSDIQDLVAQLFRRVGLRPDQMRRFPHEFSGGQRQRISVARALAVNPRLIVADEPVSALDVSIQAQVVNLLTDIQTEFGMGYLFISHDIAVVGHVSHRIAVMYLGKIVEIGAKHDVLSAPLHPYTKTLIDSVPVPNPHKRRQRTRPIRSEVPSLVAPPPGCRFHTRCPLAEERCRTEEPALREIKPRHSAACHLR